MEIFIGLIVISIGWFIFKLFTNSEFFEWILESLLYLAALCAFIVLAYMIGEAFILIFKHLFY